MGTDIEKTGEKAKNVWTVRPEAVLSERERKKLSHYFKIVAANCNFAELLKKNGFSPSERESDEIKKRSMNEMNTVAETLLLQEINKRPASTREQILANRLPKADFFEDELLEIAKKYYKEILDNSEKIDERQGKDFDCLGLEEHKTGTLEAAEEVLSKSMDEMEQKRREKISQATTEAFEEFVQKDLDQKFGRLSRGTNISPEEAQVLKEKFLADRKRIIQEITDGIAEGYSLGRRGEFNIEKIRQHDAFVGIWGKMLDIVHAPTRAIAEHAIYSPQTPNLDETLGKSPSEKEALERFNENMRKFMTDFTTHGMLGPPDPKTGERQIVSRSDLDGRACIILLKKAGFNLDKIKYVKQGEEPESGWAFDVTKEHGYVLKDGGRVLITNDSNKESGKDSSARFIFQGLKDFGLFEKIGKEEMKALEKFVEFVTKEDNKDYTDHEAEQIIGHYPKNLAGLRRYLTDEDLLRVFEEQTERKPSFNPYMVLPGIYLENLSYQNPATGEPMKFEQVSKKLHNSKKYSLEAIADSESKGFFVDTGDARFGKVLIDTGRLDAQGIRRRKIGLGWDAVRSQGCGAYVVLDEEGKYFSVQTVKDMDFDFSQGFPVSKRYWLFTGDEELKTNLEEILKKLSGNSDYQMESRIKEALEKEKKENAETEKKVNLLFEGLKIGEIEADLLKQALDQGSEENTTIAKKLKSLEEAKVFIRKIAGASNEENINFMLQEVFSDHYLRHFDTEKNKSGNVHKFENSARAVLRDYFKKKSYNDLEVKSVVNLLFKIAELKF